MSRLQQLRVCSRHFMPDDFEKDLQSEMMGTRPRHVLKPHAIPSVFKWTRKRKMDEEQLSTSQPLEKRRTEEVNKSVEALVNSEVAPKLPGSNNQDEPSIEHGSQKNLQHKSVPTVSRLQDTGNGIDVNPGSPDVRVNKACLLQLFLLCERCGCDCDARMQEEVGCFSVVQTCPFCSHHRKWLSQPLRTNETTEEPLNGEALGESDGCSSDEESKKGRKLSKLERLDASAWEPHVEDIGMDSDSDSSEDLETAGSSELPEEDKVDHSPTEIETEERLVEWCTECEAESVLTCTIQRHKKLYACGVCVSKIEGVSGFDQFYMRFNDLTSFKEHVQQEHNKKKRRLLCTECGIHPQKKDHCCETNLGLFCCPHCGKHCKSELGIKLHISFLHAEVFSCKYCLKPFRSRQNKLTHEQSHPIETCPYRCSECPERFDDIVERQRHLKTHTNLKNICPNCDKEFFDTHHLERHMLTHTGQKPYVCQVCQQSFNQKSHLKSHMRLHTGEKPFKCQVCGKCFNHNVSLKNHIKRYHGPGSQDTRKTKHLESEKRDDSSSKEQCKGHDPNSGTGQGKE
ncbi:hypothetical protein UPYG_G00296590 [Umbra pygmaea]|uniref:Uncharacterized protein n=1 Tax=Umbra pygmaea TaxID=75934 RepID=A0ABD0W6M6_UMBPY